MIRVFYDIAIDRFCLLPPEGVRVNMDYFEAMRPKMNEETDRAFHALINAGVAVEIRDARDVRRTHLGLPVTK